MTPFSFGKNITTDQVNYEGNFPYANGDRGVRRGKQTPVGSFPANAWGLSDMHGNVWQWCQDCYRDYPSMDVTDPQGPDKKGLHVLRGGSFNNDAGMCRSAYRFWVGVGTPRGRSIRRNSGGFRLCFSAEPAIQIPGAKDAQPKPQSKYAPPAAKAIRDLEYAKVGGVRLSLDLYLQAEGAGPFPVIVAIHGGDWAAGRKSEWNK